VHDLIKEYKRRTALSIVYHECEGATYGIRRYRHYKVQTESYIDIVPGTDYDTLPDRYGEARCPNCHEVFPAIEFEEIECSDDKEEKNDK